MQDEKKQIIMEIKALHEQKLSLKSKDVPNKLYKRALVVFGSWKSAVISAGIDYRAKVLNDKWSKEKIRKELLNLTNEGITLKCNGVSSELYNAIIRHYGSWQTAILDSQIEYSRKIHQKWSRELIIDEIHNIYNRKEPLNTQYIKTKYNALYNACTSKNPLYFGSWAKALEEAGYDYNKIVKVVQKPIGYWTEENVLSTIKERYEANQSLLVKDMVKEYGGICSAAYKYFGNWQNALIRAGVEINAVYGKVNKPREYWTPEKVLIKIKKIHKMGLPLNYSYIQKNYGGLMLCAINSFGSWENTLKEVGIDYSNVNLRHGEKKWSRDTIIEEIKALRSNGVSVNSKNIIDHDKKLYSAIYRYFKDWQELMNSVG